MHFLPILTNKYSAVTFDSASAAYTRRW